MFWLFLIIVSPPTGEFRTKIEKIENNIKAYKLLARNKAVETLDEETCHITRKIIYQEPGEKKFQQQQMLQAKSIFHALKIYHKHNIKFYYNNGKIEYSKI